QLPIADCGLRIGSRRNEITDRVIRLSGRFLHLLPQEIKGREPARPSSIKIKIDIVPYGIRRPKRVNSARGQQVFSDDLFKKFLRILKKFARLFADYGIIESR